MRLRRAEGEGKWIASFTFIQHSFEASPAFSKLANRLTGHENDLYESHTLSIAKRLLEKGLDWNFILETTDLTDEDLERLK